jgi:type I restriction enzyme S subunit
MELMEKQGLKQTELGLIPEDWKLSILNDLTDITRLAGYEYSTLWEETTNGEIIALRGFNIGQNKIIERDFVNISDSLSKRLIRSRLFRNDVIYPCVGSIGNAVVIEEDDKYHIQQNIAKITPKKGKIFSHYLAYYLMSEFGLKEIERFNGSSSQPNILVGSLRQYLVVTPTLTEQKAIATALSDVDALIASLEQTIIKKKAIKQGAMQQLLKPPHKGGKRLPGFSGEWVEKTLGEISSMNSGGTPSSKVSEYYDGNIKWVSISDITKAGKYIDDSAKKITEKGLQNSSARLFPINTLLLAMYASIGKCCIARAEVTTSQAILGITTTKSLLLEFLYYYLTYKQDEIANQGQQGTQSNLNKGMVQDILINIPAIEEQKAIAQILSDMDAEITQLETKKEKYQAIKQGMMQELLTGKTRLI